MGVRTRLHTINPKDRTVASLYGTLDPVSREWNDGLLSSLFRQINSTGQGETAEEQRYLVFDGDVDALWIENMNSVMDDNKLLTLVNGERIRLQPNCALLFEVDNLQYASPATVSRCGMVYVRAVTDESQRRSLEGLFNKYVPSLIDFIFDGILPTAGFRSGTGARRCRDEEEKKFTSDVGEGKEDFGGSVAEHDRGKRGRGGDSDRMKPTGRLKPIIPLVKLNIVSQLCALLKMQLNCGHEPGTTPTISADWDDASGFPTSVEPTAVIGTTDKLTSIPVVFDQQGHPAQEKIEGKPINQETGLVGDIVCMY
ncbi:unnamed protein product [Protopolystoma xenopodis]|uniref:ATPase dynein-related AAA domain-containing protein n=1 Tax=Protopolystoma xenopodis TaxID=117903 RepID=A0A448WME0_9PLAT|nr:unnamed protein product [Protopolystoma xenopodis]